MESTGKFLRLAQGDAVTAIDLEGIRSRSVMTRRNQSTGGGGRRDTSTPSSERLATSSGRGFVHARFGLVPPARRASMSASYRREGLPTPTLLTMGAPGLKRSGCSSSPALITTHRSRQRRAHGQLRPGQVVILPCLWAADGHLRKCESGLTPGAVPQRGGREVSWIDHVIWWQVYPLGFLGAEKELGPFQGEVNRLPRLQAWLDHLISWGGNGLLLGPIFTSSSHGYDTIDYFQIDPRLGDDADFDALVAACRDRGVRLLLDGVFNHAGRDFPPVAQALAEGPGSEAEDWVSHLYDTAGVITADYFEGHDHLITLNHNSARVQEYVREVMLHWLRRGIDGWRLDAAYAVPAKFWAAVLPAVREEFPDAWFVGEMIHGDYIDYVKASGLDSVTEYELWWAIWSSIDTINLHELEWTLGRHAKFVEHFLPLTFLGNHDVTRVASQIGDPRHWSHAVALLGFLPGVPSVYYGDEFGLKAVKENRPSGDDAVRPEMPTERWLFTHSHPEVEQAYRRVIGLRRRNPWLVDAMIETEQVDAARIIIRARARHGEQSLALALNLTGRPFALTGSAEVLEAEPEVADRAVAPHGWAVVAD
jgi:cyclomaltodextrinase / maltogenic alpha-amylase / neopullulanase